MTYQLHLGDCIEGMREMEGRSVDVSINDPPYEGEAHTKGRRICYGSFKERRSGNDTTRSKVISYAPITEAERREAGAQLARVVKRWILVFCQVEAAMLWRAALEAGGAQYIRTGSWHKTDAQPQLTGDRPGQGWEAVVICHGARRSGVRLEWNGGGHCAKWDGPPATWKGPSRDHGGDLSATKLVDGQKPEWLIEDLILKFSNPGDIVLDGYCGGGTTAVCALRNDRSFIGFERLPNHREMAIARIENSLRQGRLLSAAVLQPKQLTLSSDLDLP